MTLYLIGDTTYFLRRLSSFEKELEFGTIPAGMLVRMKRQEFGWLDGIPLGFYS